MSLQCKQSAKRIIFFFFQDAKNLETVLLNKPPLWMNCNNISKRISSYLLQRSPSYKIQQSGFTALQTPSKTLALLAGVIPLGINVLTE